jgi:5-formyltetrahydrofolate cyclo-ligase
VNGAHLKKAKRRLRAQTLALRDAIPPDRRRRLGQLVVERFLGLDEVRDARTIMAFWSFGSEIPTGPLIAAVHGRGVRVALPRVEGDALTPVTYVPGDPTSRTPFGAEEPAVGAPVDAAAVDVVAVPGVAFDRAGRRIGYGGGYYDRFLRGVRGFTVGLAFDLQVLDDELPAGSFDVTVRAIVTESRTIRPTAAVPA